MSHLHLLNKILSDSSEQLLQSYNKLGEKELLKVANEVSQFRSLLQKEFPQLCTMKGAQSC